MTPDAAPPVPPSPAAPAFPVVVPAASAGGLQRSSSLPVQDAASGDRLQPGRIHLAPANHHAVVESGGSLSLSTAAPVRSTRLPPYDPQHCPDMHQEEEDTHEA